MTYLPGFDSSDMATKTDVAEVRSRVDRLEEVLIELRAETRGGMAAINTRLDRLFLALLAGMFVLVAAMAGVLLTAG